MVIRDQPEVYPDYPKGRNAISAQMDSYLTPEKVIIAEDAAPSQRLQITKLKIKKEVGEDDRFATPPRRPRCPTSEQM